MSADNAVFIKKWNNRFYVWYGSMSNWQENKLHKPPNKAYFNYEFIESARKKAIEFANIYQYLEYGIIEEID